MSSILLRSHRRLATNDLDEARTHVDQLWERHNSRLTRGRSYSLLWNQAELSNSTLSFLHNSSFVRVECSPVRNCYYLTMLQSGGMRHRINNREVLAVPGNVVVHTPGQELILDVDPFRVLLVGLDANFVQQAFKRRFHKADIAQNWVPEFPKGSPYAESLRSLSRWIASELDRPGCDVITNTKVVAGLERALLEMFLEGLSSHGAALEMGDGSLGLHQLRRIEEWLDAHFADSIRVDDLAQVAGVSVRAVQSAFRRYRNCTPHEAIEQRRLAYVRDALRQATPATTVTRVALDAGFFHLGRFAGRYAHAYGERPSQTLAHTLGKAPGEPPAIIHGL